MNKPTHVIGGVATGIAVERYVTPLLTIESSTIEGLIGIVALMGGALLGSVLPDIDKRNSFLGRRVWPVSLLIELTVGHRGATHSPLFTVGLSTLLMYGAMQMSGFIQAILLFFVLGLFSGMLSHLLLDAMTKGGIPLFYPLSKRHYSLFPFKTGGVGEYIVSFGCIVIIFLMLKDLAFLDVVLANHEKTQ